MTSGDGELFISDSAGAEVYRVNPGPNKIFDGIPPIGDDQVSHFDTQVLSINDPQGIEFIYFTHTLFMVVDRVGYWSKPIKMVLSSE